MNRTVPWPVVLIIFMILGLLFFAQARHIYQAGQERSKLHRARYEARQAEVLKSLASKGLDGADLVVAGKDAEEFVRQYPEMFELMNIEVTKDEPTGLVRFTVTNDAMLERIRSIREEGKKVSP